MEIHAPDRPFHSWRDVLLHLGVVTIGILIALGLESLVEWRHHQALAREARENIVSELRDNRGEVSFFVKSIPESRKQIETALQFTRQLAEHHKISGSFHLGAHRSDVSDTSWTTAQAIGAVSYMSYAEVKKYGAAYSLQNELVREQTQSFAGIAAALSSVSENMDSSTPTETDLRVQKDRLNNLSSELVIQEQVAIQLLSRYNAVLSKK
jgi:hypothetical protein